MTMAEASALAYGSSEVFHPDEDVLPRNSPMLTVRRPNLLPSPSPPPAIPLPKVSASPSPGRESSNRRRKVRPSQGDAVLIGTLDGNRRPEIAAEAGARPLGSFGDTEEVDEDEGEEDEDDPEDEADSGKEFADTDSVEESEEVRSHDMSPEIIPPLVQPPPPPPPPLSVAAATSLPEPPATAPLDLSLRNLAAGALAAVTAHSDEGPQAAVEHPADKPRPLNAPDPIKTQPGESTIRDSSRSVLAAPSPHFPHHGASGMFSPRQSAPSQVLRPPDIKSPTGLAMAGNGDLPPIQAPSPQSDVNGPVPLPSIRSHLGDQLQEPAHFAEKELTVRQVSQPSQYPRSPSSGPLRMPTLYGASPPISPNESYRQVMGMISPTTTASATSPFVFPNAGNSHFRNGQDTSSSSTETPGSEPAIPTPATITSITDRMSIDNVTNPVGIFRCSFQGCQAPPFQTQYLLNSHANVHSSARPHYCPVKGCPRSEGGKGFKRKNEMIRHGLVHDSPGYVCPFCPDREHKYPRPDNLQRHVRVHHVDKDKDDPALRDVLSQRPDGPNRGRRRRGGP